MGVLEGIKAGFTGGVVPTPGATQSASGFNPSATPANPGASADYSNPQRRMSGSAKADWVASMASNNFVTHVVKPFLGTEALKLNSDGHGVASNILQTIYQSPDMARTFKQAGGTNTGGGLTTGFTIATNALSNIFGAAKSAGGVG